LYKCFNNFTSFIEILQNNSDNINDLIWYWFFDDMEYIFRRCRNWELWVFFELISNWRIESCGEQNTIDTKRPREDFQEWVLPARKVSMSAGNRKLSDYISFRHRKGNSTISFRKIENTSDINVLNKTVCTWRVVNRK